MLSRTAVGSPIALVGCGRGCFYSGLQAHSSPGPAHGVRQHAGQQLVVKEASGNQVGGHGNCIPAKAKQESIVQFV